MSNSDDPDIRSTIPAAVLSAHDAARAKDPTVPPIARPYWIPGGPLFTLGMLGIEKRIQAASASDDDLLLSFIAQDADARVRQVASRNPTMPRILRDAIRGATEYSPEEAAAIWFDVWKTDPEDFLSDHRLESGLPAVLLVRGYFAEDFDDVETARRWFRAAANIGVQEGRANLARVNAGGPVARTGHSLAPLNSGGAGKKPSHGRVTVQTDGEGLRAALLPLAVSIGLLVAVLIFVGASLWK